MSQPKLSVIMPAFDAEDTIDRAIESVIGQSFQDWELIVVDDASTDGTYERLKAWKRDKRLKGRITVTRKRKGGGPVGANNHGIAKASGEYIVKLDADDWFADGALEAMVTALDEHPEVGFVYGACQYYGDLHHLYKPPPTFFAKEFLDRNVAIGEVMYRTACHTEHGIEHRGFWTDGDGRWFGPHDHDLLLQMIFHLGWNGLSLPDTLILHYTYHEGGVHNRTAQHYGEVEKKRREYWPPHVQYMRDWWQMKRPMEAVEGQVDVSCLLVTWNSFTNMPEPDFLPRAVKSALDNQDGLNVEIIVVDNGSTDDTPAFIESVCAIDKRVSLVKLEKNHGIAYAMNEAAKHAKGRYYWPLTPRSWLEPEALKVLVDVLDTEPFRIGFAFGCLQFHGELVYKHIPPIWDRKAYMKEFHSRFAYLYRAEAFKRGCEYVDYVKLENGSTVGICDRDLQLQMMVNLQWDGYPVRNRTTVHYYYGGNMNEALVKENRPAIGAEFNKRWGAHVR